MLFSCRPCWVLALSMPFFSLGALLAYGSEAYYSKLGGFKMEKDNFNKENFQNVGPSFEDQSTIVDIKEILDKTKSYKDLLDASKNLDEIDRLSVLLQIVAGME